MAIPYFKTGQYFGTTAAQSVSVGFRPTAIHAIPHSTAGRPYWWSEEDLQNVFLDGDAASAASGAISLHDHGFSLPASNTSINANGAHYQYWAWRGDT